MSIEVEVADGVGTIRISNPRRRNALTPQSVDAIRAELHRLFADPAARCVILTGAGDTFCSGADLNPVHQAHEEGAPPDLGRSLTEHYHPLVSTLVHGPLPTIAAVDGVAAGAGLALALACDLRLLTHRASLRFSFVDVGLAPDSGASYFLPRLLGRSRAAELALLGGELDAGQAVATGLAVAAVDPGQLQDHARRVAQRIASLPPLAVERTRQLLRYGETRPLPDVLAREASVQRELGATAEHRQALDGFFEHRRPDPGRAGPPTS